MGSRVVDVVKVLVQDPKINIAPAVLAETYRALSRIKVKKGVHMTCCSQLLTMWIHGHFPKEQGRYGSCFMFLDVEPIAKLRALEKRKMALDWRNGTTHFLRLNPTV